MDRAGVTDLEMAGEVVLGEVLEEAFAGAEDSGGVTAVMTSRKIKIALASGKGGTGKTMLAVNLASYLSQKKKTLLIDLDVEEPNDFLFVKGEVVGISESYKMIPEWDESRCNLCGICSAVCNFHAVIQLGDYIAIFNELCHSCHACSELCPKGALPMKQHKMGEIKTISNGNLTLVESRLTVGEEQAVPLINQTHDHVQENYGDFLFQIFDCPPGTACPMAASVKKADFVVLVTEPTPFGLHDLKLAAETVAGLSIPFGVVINREGIGNGDVEKYCFENHVPVMAHIPFDKEIAILYSKGQLLVDNYETLLPSFNQIMDHIENGVYMS